MAGVFLGSGWAFPVQVGDDGTIALAVCTVARFVGGRMKTPGPGGWGGRLVPPLPSTAAGSPPIRTSGLSPSVSIAWNGSTTEVGGAPPTLTRWVSWAVTRSPCRAAGCPIVGLLSSCGRIS